MKKSGTRGTNTTTSRNVARSFIMRTVENVRAALVYDPKEECTVLPNGRAFGCFTNSARYLQTILGGFVVGYDHADNPTAELGAAESGHDFLVVDQFIVDVWAAEAHGAPAVIDRRDTSVVTRLYGNPAQWDVWQGGKFSRFTRRDQQSNHKRKAQLHTKEVSANCNRAICYSLPALEPSHASPRLDSRR